MAAAPSGAHLLRRPVLCRCQGPTGLHVPVAMSVAVDLSARCRSPATTHQDSVHHHAMGECVRGNSTARFSAARPRTWELKSRGTGTPIACDSSSRIHPSRSLRDGLPDMSNGYGLPGKAGGLRELVQRPPHGTIDSRPVARLGGRRSPGRLPCSVPGADCRRSALPVLAAVTTMHQPMHSKTHSNTRTCRHSRLPEGSCLPDSVTQPVGIAVSAMGYTRMRSRHCLVARHWRQAEALRPAQVL